MQKRRALPLTTSDVPSSDGTQKQSTTTKLTTKGKRISRIRKRKNIRHPNKSSSNNIGEIFYGIGGFIAFVFLFVFFMTYTSRLGTDHHNHHHQHHHQQHQQQHNFQSSNEDELPLAKFKDLAFALQHSEIIALYFASSWCGESAPITKLLDESFDHHNRDSILLTRRQQQQQETNVPLNERALLSIVYISSDKTEQEMMDYTRDYWIDIPWKSLDRNNLKQHFRTFAKKHENFDELRHIERNHEIPTIIVLDGKSQEVITTEGVKELKEHGSDTLYHWLTMQRMLRSLNKNKNHNHHHDYDIRTH